MTRSSGMGQYVARRIAQMVFVILGVTLGSFTLLHIVPGDPARTLLGVHATPGEIAVLRHEWGLDKPLPTQYVLYLGRLLHGNLGTSVTYQSSVASLIGHALPVTLLMLALGTLFAIVVAVPVAVMAATHAGRPVDHLVRTACLFGLGMPPFWIGFVLLVLFSVTVPILPSGGYGATFGQHVQSLILPGLTVAAVTTPILVRSLRTSLIEILDSDFVTAARGRGLSGRRVLVRHALRNTVVPSISVLAVNLGYLLGGTAVVENVFGLPGVGNLLLSGIFNRDFDIVQSVTLVYAAVVVAINLTADIGYAAMDPRVVLAP